MERHERFALRLERLPIRTVAAKGQNAELSGRLKIIWSSTGAFGRIRGGNELEKVREDDVGGLGCSLDGRFRDNEAGL